MPRFFFQHTDGTYSDCAYYDEQPASRDGGTWQEGEPSIPAFQVQSPLEAMTAAVKQLPVEKRVSPLFGVLLSQCLLALQNADIEAFAYLLDNFQTDDADYQTLITQAKTAFGL